MNILIAEDNQIIQMIQRTLMENWGFKYDLAANGLEAVEYAKKNNGKYDLCLMDIDMPKMNGIEATKIIRRVVDYFPILALTADDTRKVASLEAGMDDFAVKPCSREDLLARIKKLTVKAYKLISNRNGIDIKKVKPMNAEQLKELRELEEQGLAVLVVENGLQKFIVHKNIQNKMSRILIGEGKELFEFLDRSDNPAICHLYKCNMQTNRLLLTPEQFTQRAQKEDDDIEKYTQLVDQNIDTNN